MQYLYSLTIQADIRSCASLFMSILFSLGGLPARPPKPPFLEDQFVSRNTSSTTNPEDEEIVDAQGNDGNA